MAAEINLALAMKQLPIIKQTIYENRKIILVPVVGVTLYYLLKKPVKDAWDRFFCDFYQKYLLNDVNAVLKQFRQKMGKELGELKTLVPSADPDNVGLTIVEIGMGPGSSLDYYPKGSMITAVETNAFFCEILREKQAKYPDLVAVVNGMAEDLTFIPDNSVDIVVSFFVLCSVTDVKKVLSEAKRVLVKGGRFYFYEHELCKFSNKRALLQRVLNPFWIVAFDGCHLNRRLAQSVRSMKFELEEFREELGRMRYPVRCVTMGYVVK